MKKLAQFFLRLLVAIAYWAYKAEGLNALLLLLPAKMIAPLLRQYGATIGGDPEIHSPLLIHNASDVQGQHYARLHIGDGCYFGRQVLFDIKDTVTIENTVTVSMRVTFITHTDVGKSPLAGEMPPSQAPIVVRRGAYIGAGAILLQGIEIGEGAVVAAGALVNRSVPPGTVVTGVPARQVRQLDDSSA